MKVKALTAACLLCFALVSSAQAADERVTLNFVNSDLEATLKAVTIITGKSFVIDPKLKGTVNIVSSQPVERNLVLPIVQSALRQQGITLIDNGTVVKVLAEGDAKQHASPLVLGKGAIGTGDKFVTQVYPLRFESATQLAQVLRPMLGANSVIAAYQAGNVLVISDYAENLSRINRMIEHIDQAPNSDVQAFPIKSASVLDVAQTIARLMPEVVVQGVSAPVPVPDGVKRVLVVTDTRNSQLLVRSESATHLNQIKRIVEMLDREGAAGSSMHVVYLRNAEAARLAATLRGILTGQDSGGGSSSPSASTSTASGSSNQASLTAASASTQSSTSTGNTATNVKIDGASVMIQADSVTNSLIITAPDHIYNDIRAIVEKLDVRRAQVYVEAMIAEVNVTKAGEFGFQWAVAGGGSKFAGGVISSLSGGSNSIATIASGLLSDTATAVPEGFNVGLFNGDPTNGTASLGALASAIEKSGDGNVLSTPNLQTLDNEEARIVVGQNIPIITGTQLSSSNSNPFTTVERKDIGIKLKIKPQISEAGAITLNVAQEVSSIDTTVATSGTGIATKVRTIETKVLVDDGQIIVLGGLIEDRQTTSDNRVPVLSYIPLIGHLFRYQSRTHEKVNLMVFLRPTILRDGKASATMANERYEYLRARQGEFTLPHSFMLPDMPTTQLPPLSSPPAAAEASPSAAPAAAPVKP
ncbi:type II secretion system secretin GspD [Uliginosibacterium sp. 31-16]|uniref:type II secretion system secretin GspD n=1 Tax=Uliginosibacterium sp. 31-16 TaxID=3068315 RepID=UPI00273E0502|nr:type II secretion system secretin GspD [Uliginosibacterium sp. 31-16]MDP5240927.1 type II secretion system secretin GspD [Uliginosibacterium sp. 31-16]